MKMSLILYPAVSWTIWLLYCILQIFADYANNDKSIMYGFMRNGIGSQILVILISLRQFIFDFLFFWTQGGLKKYAYNYITCQNKNKKRNIDNENDNDNDNERRFSE